MGGQTGHVSMVHERPETVFVRKEWAMGADRPVDERSHSFFL